MDPQTYETLKKTVPLALIVAVGGYIMGVFGEATAAVVFTLMITSSGLPTEEASTPTASGGMSNGPTPLPSGVQEEAAAAAEKYKRETGKSKQNYRQKAAAAIKRVD